jgi:hypothetical protein
MRHSKFRGDMKFIVTKNSIEKISFLLSFWHDKYEAGVEQPFPVSFRLSTL